MTCMEYFWDNCPKARLLTFTCPAVILQHVTTGTGTCIAALCVLTYEVTGFWGHTTFINIWQKHNYTTMISRNRKYNTSTPPESSGGFKRLTVIKQCWVFVAYRHMRFLQLRRCILVCSDICKSPWCWYTRRWHKLLESAYTHLYLWTDKEVYWQFKS